MLEQATDIQQLAQPFLTEFDMFCAAHDLVGKVKADHIGMRCSNKEIYERQRALFEFESTFIYQSIIASRRISIIGLTTGLETVVGPLNYLELSDQKPDGSQVDKIDHLEIVPVTLSYEELAQKLKVNGVEMKEVIRPHHTTYDIVLPSGFTIKLSQEMLVDKIKREEMK